MFSGMDMVEPRASFEFVCLVWMYLGDLSRTSGAPWWNVVWMSLALPYCIHVCAKTSLDFDFSDNWILPLSLCMCDVLCLSEHILSNTLGSVLVYVDAFITDCCSGY